MLFSGVSSSTHTFTHTFFVKKKKKQFSIFLSHLVYKNTGSVLVNHVMPISLNTFVSSYTIYTRTHTHCTFTMHSHTLFSFSDTEAIRKEGKVSVRWGQLRATCDPTPYGPSPQEEVSSLPPRTTPSIPQPSENYPIWGNFTFPIPL